MQLEKIKSNITITVYDVIDEQTAIQARADVSSLRAEIRRIEAEKLRITAPLREQVNAFNSEVKKITDVLNKILDALTSSGNAYLAKQKEIKNRAEQIERERIALEQRVNNNIVDPVAKALELANSITEPVATVEPSPVATRKKKILKYDMQELKIWLAKNAPQYLDIDERAVLRDIALLNNCPVSIEEIEVL